MKPASSSIACDMYGRSCSRAGFSTSGALSASIPVQTGWGAISLTWALQRLLAAALREPRNQRFVLLSESGVPLYPALVVYQALMGEPRSRVAACLDASLPPPGVRQPQPHMCPVFFPLHPPPPM